MRYAAASLLLFAAACGQEEPSARTEDLWPGFRRVAATAMPTAEEIERACSEAFMHFKEEAEKTPHTYVDPTYHDYPVRSSVCTAEADAASTVNCRFEQSDLMIAFPTPEERKASLARMTDADWKPQQARLVFAANGPGTQRWIAPGGCQAVLPPQATGSAAP